MQFFAIFQSAFCYLSIQPPTSPLLYVCMKSEPGKGGVAILVKPDEQHVASGE